MGLSFVPAHPTDGVLHHSERLVNGVEVSQPTAHLKCLLKSILINAIAYHAVPNIYHTINQNQNMSTKQSRAGVLYPSNKARPYTTVLQSLAKHPLSTLERTHSQSST
jgi:hypothetical protein